MQKGDSDGGRSDFNLHNCTEEKAQFYATKGATPTSKGGIERKVTFRFCGKCHAQAYKNIWHQIRFILHFKCNATPFRAHLWGTPESQLYRKLFIFPMENLFWAPPIGNVFSGIVEKLVYFSVFLKKSQLHLKYFERSGKAFPLSMLFPRKNGCDIWLLRVRSFHRIFQHLIIKSPKLFSKRKLPFHLTSHLHIVFNQLFFFLIL